MSIKILCMSFHQGHVKSMTFNSVAIHAGFGVRPYI